METIEDVLNNFAEFFNSRNIPFIIGGGYAIKLLCDKYSILFTHNVNNLDIFYLTNTPITPEKIKHYKRKQTSPCTSVTYIAEDGFEINLTMMRSHIINIIIDDNQNKIMHPKNLINYYIDEFERSYITDFKQFVLTNIIELIDEKQTYCLGKNNIVFIAKQPSLPQTQRTSRRSLDFGQMLKMIQE